MRTIRLPFFKITIEHLDPDSGSGTCTHTRRSWLLKGDMVVFNQDGKGSTLRRFGDSFKVTKGETFRVRVFARSLLVTVRRV